MKSIARHSFIPMRATPSECSEMVSQIVFGETFEVLDSLDRWLRVRNDYDGYEGWVDRKLVDILEPSDVEAWLSAPSVVVDKFFVRARCVDANEIVYLPMGAVARGIHPDNSGEAVFSIGARKFSLSAAELVADCQDIFSAAERCLGVTYLWGGRTPFGIDCSGFVQMLYRIAGIALPRDASKQAKVGVSVDIEKDIRRGDLAFFGSAADHITHVGLCLGGGRIIHASGNVRIDSLTPKGIWNSDRGVLSHELVSVVRVRP